MPNIVPYISLGDIYRFDHYSIAKQKCLQCLSFTMSKQSFIHCGFHTMLQTDCSEIQLLLLTFDNLLLAFHRNPCTSGIDERKTSLIYCPS